MIFIIFRFSLLIFIKRSSFYATSTSQSSSRLKKPVKYLQSAPELHWLKFTQNDFFWKLVLTHPPTFWHGVGNFSFWNPLLKIKENVYIKGARTYCIINEAAPSGVVAMDYFSSLKAVINALAHLQHYLAYVLLLCKNSVGWLTV